VVLEPADALVPAVLEHRMPQLVAERLDLAVVEVVVSSPERGESGIEPRLEHWHERVLHDHPVPRALEVLGQRSEEQGGKPFFGSGSILTPSSRIIMGSGRNFEITVQVLCRA
jgi:hypothetical protein